MLTCLYWFLAIAGGVFTTLSFIVGELVDIGEDAIGGVFGFIGDALEGIFGGSDVGEVDVADVGGVVDVDSGPSPFSFRTVMMFLTGFGAGGLVGSGMGLSEPMTLVPAFGFGVVTGAITWLFVRFLYREQATTSIQPTDYIGLIGRVTVSIPESRLGQVAVEVKMQKKLMPARSQDGAAIPAQTYVHVVSMEGGVLRVKKLE